MTAALIPLSVVVAIDHMDSIETVSKTCTMYAMTLKVEYG